jgi:hypothetical protein
MNQLITFDEAAGFLINPPSVMPRPDFTKIRVIQTHITKALKQLDCPQSPIHGWLGLAMDPTMYALIELSPFVAPPDPGDVPICPNFAALQVLKTINKLWENAINYYLSYINISRACFRMLDETIPDQFKVSNNPTLIGWNPMMSIQSILTQLENTFGQPGGLLMWNKDKIFRADFLPNNAPKLLFLRIKQCQEVVIIACNLYSEKQIIANTIHLLLQSGIFPMKEFEDWEAANNKTWTSLKRFVHGAFQCQLVAVGIRGSTSGQQGYAPPTNPYMLFAEGLDSDDNTTVTQTTAATTVGSMLGNTYATPAPPSTMTDQLALVMQLLTKNQQAISQHMAAMPYQANQPLLQPCRFPAPRAMPFHMPLIQNLQIPAQGNFNPLTPPFNAGGIYNARGYGQIGQSAGRHGHGCGCQHRKRLPFDEQMAQGDGNPGTTGALYNPNVQHMTHSNINKLYGNWDACYMCRFDIKDGHTSMTCPQDWHKMTHIKAFTHGNAQTYIAAGYNCCTRGMHKTILPNAAF